MKKFCILLAVICIIAFVSGTGAQGNGGTELPIHSGVFAYPSSSAFNNMVIIPCEKPLGPPSVPYPLAWILAPKPTIIPIPIGVPIPPKNLQNKN